MMRSIYLHGVLANKFGERYDLDVTSAAEAARGLGVQLKGFMQLVRQHNFKIVVVGDKEKYLLGEPELAYNLGNANEVHFVPVVGGAGGDNGTAKIIAGVAITAIAVAGALYTGGASLSLGASLGQSTGVLGITYGQVAALGVSIALSGVSQMLAPSPQGLGGRERPEERPSFIFNRPVNTAEQGNPVPLVYGRFRVGSQVISSGIAVEQLDTSN